MILSRKLIIKALQRLAILTNLSARFKKDETYPYVYLANKSRVPGNKDDKITVNQTIMNNFWIWWQHLPEKMSPVIFEIGWFKLQYYGLMYIIAFAESLTFMVLYRVRKRKTLQAFQMMMFKTSCCLSIIGRYRRRAFGICAVLQFVILSEQPP